MIHLYNNVTAVLFLTIGLLLAPTDGHTQQSRLDRILVLGEIRIGTTGDFKPFSYWNPESQAFEGLDIDAAHLLGEALGVTVRFVPTTWPTLAEGILKDRYDVAMGGITRTLARQKIVGLTASYFTVGKVPLIRKADRDRFQSLEDINRPDVRIGVNPGGTNERFVRERLKDATVIVIEKNLEIPGRVAAGEVDVMITDNVEAILYAGALPELHAVNPGDPYTRDDFGYMTLRDDQALLNWLNLWIDQMKRDGSFDRLRQKWIGQ